MLTQLLALNKWQIKSLVPEQSCNIKHIQFDSISGNKMDQAPRQPTNGTIDNFSSCQHQNSNRKKVEYSKTHRILINHDLDQCLVYGKRMAKPIPLSFREIPQNSIQRILKLKKEKKVEKIEEKERKIPQEITCKKKQPASNDASTSKERQSLIKALKQVKNSTIDLKDHLQSNKILDKIQSNKIQRKKYQNRIRKALYKPADSDNQSVQKPRFPFLNQYVKEHVKQYLKTMQAIDKKRQVFQNPDKVTFVNCDVKYFKWNAFINQVGKFDVLIIDPPWRIKGAQQNDSQFMFSNCKFSLEYSTMSNNQIKQLPLHLISDEGFIFLWILNTQLDSSLEIMQKWGYQLIDELVWIKLRQYKIYLTHGYYFMHSFEICLIGYKKPKNKQPSSILSEKAAEMKQLLKARANINANIVFAGVGLKSQKPEQIYTLIQMMFKNHRKVEIFARNHNRRFGIFSIGNELGQSYEKWMQTSICDKCSNTITIGNKRYKSRLEANFDLCQKCYNSKQEGKQDFLELLNEVNQDVRHQYISCNHCGAQPIWGARFYCETCCNYDLCQACFDKNLQKSPEEKMHPIDHVFNVLQVPFFGNGFPIHEHKCYSCYQNPIVGISYNCLDCRNFKLCQKCFFQRPSGQNIFNSKNHRPQHEFEAIFEPQLPLDKKYECFSCKKQVLQECWMCLNCYNFFFCQSCYDDRYKFKSLYANNHKIYHVYAKIF